MTSVEKSDVEEYIEVFKKFLNDTQGENLLQIILRSHLYIENSLETIIENIFERPQVLLSGKAMFANKLSLVFASGVIPHEFNVLLKYFNQHIRNQYAHNLNFELTEDHLEQLKSRFDRQTREAHQIYVKLLKDMILRDDRLSGSFDSLADRLKIIMAVLLISLKKYHITYLRAPLEKEVNELQEIVQITLKEPEKQHAFFKAKNY